MSGSLVVCDDIKTYLSDIDRYPLFSQEEEFSIAEQYFKFRKVEDAHRLAVSNLRYVIKIAFEYRTYWEKISDLVQEGNIGLMMAIKKFDPYKGVRFLTYATYYIRACIQNYILKMYSMVNRDVRELKKKLFCKHDADIKSISKDASLDAQLFNSDRTYVDILVDEKQNQEKFVEENEYRIVLKRNVEKALDKLTVNERFVIEQRYMVEEPASLQSIGDELGISRQRVQQIEVQAQKKLKKVLGKVL